MNIMIRFRTVRLIFCFLLLFILNFEIMSADKNKILLIDRIEGMLVASAIADAMAGPFEGRQTEVSQKFLQDGGWIDRFENYTPGFQHHWNVYSRTAPAGTFTDDNRLRLLIAEAMIESDRQNPGTRMSRRFLADFILQRYRIATTAFEMICHIHESRRGQAFEQIMEQNCKEKFLNLWFLWEITKTATEVFIPDDPPIFSPPAIREGDHEYSPDWQLKKIAPMKVERNIKASYHHNCYERGDEMPLGLIALLPLSVYFPGDPVSAFHYILEIDFFDIKDADLYPATVGAILADLLGGVEWDAIMGNIEKDGLTNYLNCSDREAIHRLQQDVDRALSISRQFKAQPGAYSRSNYFDFIKALHQNFAVGEVMMCTVDEMFSASLAIMDYAPKNLKQIIEMAVNYGRDNDTVASMVACYGGAALGMETIPIEWKKIVENANEVKFQSIARSLSLLKK
jgi:ADP-ribosylglycohydrolase